MDFTYRELFRRFQQSVKEYSEILTSGVFKGRKLGDAQLCFDIQAIAKVMRGVLIDAGVPADRVEAILGGIDDDDDVRIEVKGKLAHARSGPASVVHCNEGKVRGVKRRATEYKGMTHLLVVLVQPGERCGAGRDPAEEGDIEAAWLFPVAAVPDLRAKQPDGYIPVKKLRQATTGIDITRLLQRVAEQPIV